MKRLCVVFRERERERVRARSFLILVDWREVFFSMGVCVCVCVLFAGWVRGC